MCWEITKCLDTRMISVKSGFHKIEKQYSLKLQALKL